MTHICLPMWVAPTKDGVAGEVNRAAYLRRRIERPRLADMTEDFGLLASELERCFGGTGTIPTRAQMRAIARTDLEKAIAAHGGPAAVAKRMGWTLAYKVRHQYMSSCPACYPRLLVLNGLMSLKIAPPRHVLCPALFSKASAVKSAHDQDSPSIRLVFQGCCCKVGA